jgi:CRP/FNR family transcriptional regulator, nitrogen oxide reductase regulator
VRVLACRNRIVTAPLRPYAVHVSSPERALLAKRPARDARRCVLTEVPANTADAAKMSARLLQGFSDTDRDEILTSAKERCYPPGALIYEQGAPAEEIFLLLRGRARCFYTTQEGQRVLLLWLTPGEAFGGKALLRSPSSYAISLEALKESRVLVWNRSTIRSLAERYPRIIENALSIATDYLEWYLAVHAALVFHSAPRRLAEVLVCLARAIGREVPGGIELDVTNEELGGVANLTPFSVSRLLNEWRRGGAITKSRGKVVLRAPQRLLASIA